MITYLALAAHHHWVTHHTTRATDRGDVFLMVGACIFGLYLLRKKK